MVTANIERTYSHLFTTFDCQCGGSLRVKVELAGTEVRCWSCHKMVVVPFPRSSSRTARVLREGIAAAFEAPVVVAVGVGAAILTAALAIPVLGVPAATLAMTLLAFGYGEWIGRSGPDEAEDGAETLAPDPGIRRLVLRGLAALALGLGATAPWLIRPGGLDVMPRFTWLTLVPTVFALVACPLAMFAAFGHGDSGPLGWREARSLIVRYPYATAGALAVIPAAAVVAEFTTFFFASLLGWLPFFLVELFPAPEGLLHRLGLPYFEDYSIFGLPDLKFLRMYAMRLGRGEFLIAAIPSSLPLPKPIVACPWAWVLNLPDALYFWARFGFTYLIASFMLMGLAIQARWLGVLSRVESRRALH